MKKHTIKEVAQEAGVSTATISRVLNNTDYVSDDVKARVWAAVNKLQYRPNAFARSLKLNRSRSIGLVLPDMTNPYFMTVARSLKSTLLPFDYQVLLMDSGEDVDKEKEALNVLAEKRVEAIVLASTGGNQELVQLIDSSGIVMLLADRKLEQLGLDSVTEDNEQAVLQAIDYLAGRGARRIAIVSGPESISTARERRAAALSAIRAAGLPWSDAYLFSGDYSKQAGIAAAHYLWRMAEPPDAVFSGNNEMTFGLYLGMKQLGLPLDRMDIASFGDLEFASLFHNRLAVIKQHPVEVGEALGQLVLQRLQQDVRQERQQIVIQPIFRPYAD